MNLRCMVMTVCLVSILSMKAAGQSAEPISTPLPVEVSAAKMSLPEGFQVSLFAGEPDVVQPIAMTFDPRGRLWVVECLSYPHWTNDGSGHDRVTILEDTNGDGQHDKRTVFLDNGVNLSGIELGFGGVWLTATPNLIFVPDRDGDDRPDGPPEILLDGWDLKAQHNVFNGLIWGPDGWLYGCNGILSNSLVGAPGTPQDRRTPMNCGVWRYHPIGKTFEVVASGSTNPWGLDFDEYGQAFITNCVIKHLFHVVPGAHYERMFGQDLNPYTYTLLPSCADHIHWGGGHWTSSRSGAAHDDPGGGHAHSGCAIYLGDNFPAEYRNNVFMCNIHGNRLNRDLLERRGAGYEAHHARDFLKANDPWFRGIAVKCGPEGALYFTDWTDTGECHNYEVADQSNGRIYRVTYGELHGSLPNLAAATNQQLVNLQFDRNEWKVRTARRLLQERSVDNNAAMEIAKAIARLQPKDDREALRQLWALHAVGGVDAIRRLGIAINGSSEWVRFWTIQLAADEPQSWTSELRDEIAAQLEDSTPLIRRALLSTCQQRIRAGHLDDVRDLLRRLLSNSEDRGDTLLQALCWYAVEPLVASNPDLVLAWLPETNSPLVQQFVARRLITLDGGLDRLVTAWQSVEDGDWYVGSLAGVLQAYAGVERLPMPAKWTETYARLQRHANASVRHDAKLLGTIFGDKGALEEFRTVLNNPAATAEGRLEALDVLLARKADRLDQTLRSLLDDTEFTTAAIRGLAAMGGDDVAELLLARYATVTEAQQQEIIYALTTRPAYAHDLLDAIEKGSVPRRDVSALVIRQLQSIQDAALAERLSEVWGQIRPVSEGKQALIDKYRSELTPESLASANLSAGKEIYSKTCGTCHKLFGEGGTIAPELTGSQRTNLDYLLDNILDPSAIVPSDYRVVILMLDDGRFLQGIVVEESSLSLTLRTATQELTIPLSNIEERKLSNVSMMPEGMLDNLSSEDRRNLIAYLQSPAGVDVADAARGVEQWHLLDRVWQSDVIHGESTVLLQESAGAPFVGRLAFPVAEIMSVRSSNREHTYDASDNLTLNRETGQLSFPGDADVPHIKVADLFPPIDSPNSYKHRVGHPEQALLYGPGRWFHDHQLEITYRRKATDWQGVIPAFAAEQLPRTIAKLRQREPLTVGVSGDSIAFGGDASSLNDVAPRQPAFPELVVQQLEASYGGPVRLKNRAISGWSIANGLDDLEALLAERPDVIILAYGMNDVGRRDPDWFRDRNQEFIDRVRAADPAIEIIMVSPMLGHAEWVHTPRDMFFKYRDQLVELTGPGIVLADVTSVWQELLERKHDLDLTGNGLNHPNDFGHRLYAQVILALLVK